jgi:hypothetical protein
MIVESCAKTWPVCHRSFVDWLAGLDDSLDISHIPALSDPGAGTRLQSTHYRLHESRRGYERRDVERPRLSARGPGRPPPSIDDTSDLPESAESECWRWSGSRRSGPPSARERRVRSSRPSRAVETDDIHAPDHIRYVGVPTGDRSLIRSGRPAAKPVLIVRNGARSRGETADRMSGSRNH